MGKTYRSNQDLWRPGPGSVPEEPRERGRGRSSSRDRHRSPPSSSFSSRRRKGGAGNVDSYMPRHNSPIRDVDRSHQSSYRDRKRSRDRSPNNSRRSPARHASRSRSPRRRPRDDQNDNMRERSVDRNAKPRHSSKQKERHRSPKRHRTPSPHYLGAKSSKKSRKGRSPTFTRRPSPDPYPSNAGPSRGRDNSRGRSPRRGSIGPGLRAHNSPHNSIRSRESARRRSPVDPPRQRSVSPAKVKSDRRRSASRHRSPHQDELDRYYSPDHAKDSPNRRRKFSPPTRPKRDRKRRRGSPRRRTPPPSSRRQRSPSPRTSRQPASPPRGDDYNRMSPPRDRGFSPPPTSRANRAEASLQISYDDPVRSAALSNHDADVFMANAYEERPAEPRTPSQDGERLIEDNKVHDMTLSNRHMASPRSPRFSENPLSQQSPRIPTSPRESRGSGYKRGRGRHWEQDVSQQYRGDFKKKRSPRGKRRGGGSDFGRYDDDRFPRRPSTSAPFTGANAIPTGPAQHNNQDRYDSRRSPPRGPRDSYRDERDVPLDNGNYSRFADHDKDSRPQMFDRPLGIRGGRFGRRGSGRGSPRRGSRDFDRSHEEEAISSDAATRSEDIGSHRGTMESAFDRHFDYPSGPANDMEGRDIHYVEPQSNSMPPPPVPQRTTPPDSEQQNSTHTPQPPVDAPTKPRGGDEPKSKIRFTLNKAGKAAQAPHGPKFDGPTRGPQGRGFGTSANSTPVGRRRTFNNEDRCDSGREAPPAATSPQVETLPRETHLKVPKVKDLNRVARKFANRATSIYDRITMVGEGTYGKVYKAQNAASKQLVALKRIRLEQERDGFPVTALREMKLLQTLQHENVICLIETMVEKNQFYMVFEYMDHDLTGILNHPTFKLTLANIKDLAKQFFEGVAYLHHRGVLHRDIKGSNILLNNDGQLKLADFGLARSYQKRKKDLDYTNRIITLWYRPPEILLGATQYDASVDIWSAGCVLVELFTRKAIFPGRGEIDQLDCIYSILGTPNLTTWPDWRKMPWYELIRPKCIQPSVFDEKFKEVLPNDALDLVHQLFEYDPAKRPTAAQVLEHEYFQNEPAPEPCTAIRDLKGDWHEYESKERRKRDQQKQQEQNKAQAVAGRDARLQEQRRVQ